MRTAFSVCLPLPLFWPILLHPSTPFSIHDPFFNYCFHTHTHTNILKTLGISLLCDAFINLTYVDGGLDLQSTQKCHSHHSIQNKANDGMNDRAPYRYDHIKTAMIKTWLAMLEGWIISKSTINNEDNWWLELWIHGKLMDTTPNPVQTHQYTDKQCWLQDHIQNIEYLCSWLN